MAYLCPADFQPLQAVFLEHNLPAQKKPRGHYCLECGGAFLGAQAQKGALGNGIQVPESAPAAGRPCPVCSERMRIMPVGRLEIEGCSACNALWFDAAELAVTALFLRDAGIPSPVPEGDSDPIAPPHVLCADTGKPAREPLKMVDMGFGLVSQESLTRPGFGTSPSGDGEHRFRYRGAEVVVQHGSSGSAYQGSVDITSERKGRLSATLSSAGLGKRLKGFFGKKSQSLGVAEIDAMFWIETSTEEPLRDFVRSHGVRDLLGHLVRLAERYELAFSPGGLRVEITGPKGRVADEMRRGCENLTRLLFDRYVRFHE